MYRTVVVPLDGSARAEAALPIAAAFARRALAEVDLVTVRDESYGVHGADPSHLERLAATLTAPLGEIAVLAGGDPASELVAYAARRPDAIVCMTTHARSGVGEVLLGSVAEAVIHDSEQGVLLVGPAVPHEPVPTFDLMLVALDGSRFSEQILRVAESWHEAIGTRPWLIQVQDPALVAVAARSHGDVQESAYLRRVAGRLDRKGIDADYDVLHDRDPAWAIARFAGDLPASVVAVATHARRGAARMVLGSVAIGVVHRAHCPVLVVRGDDD